MPEYINPNTYIVHLSGPNGEEISMAPRERRVLSEYYDKYRARGFIKLIGDKKPDKTIQTKVRNKLSLNRTRRNIETPMRPMNLDKDRQQLQQRKLQRQAISKARKIIKKPVVKDVPTRQIVGRKLLVNANELLYRNLDQHPSYK